MHFFFVSAVFGRFRELRVFEVLIFSIHRSCLLFTHITKKNKREKNERAAMIDIEHSIEYHIERKTVAERFIRFHCKEKNATQENKSNIKKRNEELPLNGGSLKGIVKY